MKSKFDNRIGKGGDGLIPLLPHTFKKIGFLLLILPFLLAIIFRMRIIELATSQMELLKYLGFNVLIFGLFLIMWTRDKVEDELTMALRTKSMALALMISVFGCAFKPLSDLLLHQKITDLNGQDVLFSLLAVYFLLFYLQKKGR